MSEIVPYHVIAAAELVRKIEWFENELEKMRAELSKRETEVKNVSS